MNTPPRSKPRPGDTFTLAHGAAHTERYGPEGATYWVARRNPR